VKFDRYVIQILDPKSERNAFGHVVSFNVLALGCFEGLRGLLAGSLGGCGGAYSLPRHHIDAAGTSFLGSGSQKYCTMRLHFSMSMVMVGGSFQRSVWLWWYVVWIGVVIQDRRGVDIYISNPEANSVT
jgi:hypothetical protein